MPMKKPVHPGRVVRHDCLDPLGLSITAGAKVLGVSRQTLTKVVSGKSGISPEMAIRLTKAFGSTVGNVVADAACLRPGRRPQGRKQNQGAPPTRPGGTAGAVTRGRAPSPVL